MEEIKFKLGQEVTVEDIVVKGTVIGIWQSLHGRTQYRVRRYDTSRRVTEFWYYAEELS